MAIVIYPQTLDWNFMKQRPQQMMAQLGKLGHTVFFLNQTQTADVPMEVEENVYVVSNRGDFLNEILPSARKRNKVIVWTTWPKLWKRIERFQPDKIIYDSCDEFPQWARYERRMIESADAVVCSAKTIFTRLQTRFPEKRIQLIRNAADSSFINTDKLEKPQDMPFGNPIVGYVGAWAYWVDHDLMEKLLKVFPHVNFVVLGVPYGHVPSYNQSNLYFLGPKPHEVLPNYIRNFDVGIIPFQYNPITLATNPIKAYEYLSLGIDVLSTAIPECIEMEPFLTTATSHDDFIQKLGNLLSKKRLKVEIEQRVRFASQNTWSERGIKADRLIQEILLDHTI